MLHRKYETAFKELVDSPQRDRQAFKESLARYFDTELSIEMVSHDRSGRIGTHKESLANLAFFYISYMQKSPQKAIGELNALSSTNRLSDSIHEEASQMRSTVLSISDYPKLVKQVGQLGV